MNRSLPNKEEQRRIKLYKQGLSDGEMAKIFGCTRGAIRSWRYRRGLGPNHRPPEHVGKHKAETPGSMKESLTPAQCQVMRRFLSDLLWYSKQSANKPDVMAFAREWGLLYSKEVV